MDDRRRITRVVLGAAWDTFHLLSLAWRSGHGVALAGTVSMNKAWNVYALHYAYHENTCIESVPKSGAVAFLMCYLSVT